MDESSDLTVADAVPRITAVVGESRSAADAVVRQLQRHDPPLFPVPKGRGGGKNAARHTLAGGTNLMFALALQGQAVVDRPALILPYREMPVVPGAGWPIGLDPENAGVLAEAVRDWTRAVTGAEPDWPAGFRLVPGDTLGDGCDGLVDWMARPEGQTIRGLFRTFGAWLDLGVGFSRPPCSFGCDTRGGEGAAGAIFSAHYRPRTWPGTDGAAEAPGVTITARVHCRVFEILADLWAEARPRPVGLFTPSSGSALPPEAERKSAGDGVTSTPPTLPLDRSHKTPKAKPVATGHTQHPESSARALAAQAFGASRNGPSPQSREDVSLGQRSPPTECRPS